jgi:hypothetical protein
VNTAEQETPDSRRLPLVRIMKVMKGDPDVEVSLDFLEIILRSPGSNNWIIILFQLLFR